MIFSYPAKSQYALAVSFPHQQSPTPVNVRLLCTFLLLVFSALPLRADQFDVLRNNWKDNLTGGALNTSDPDISGKLTSLASVANSRWTTMDKSASRTFLWSDASSKTDSAALTTCYSRLRDMAIAYATQGCSLQGNASLIADIKGGLDWMYTNRYNSTKSIYDNWWDFEIGVPMALVDIVALIYDQLSATQVSNYMSAVEKFTPSATTPASGGTTGTFTGANRMWKIQAVAVRGAIVKDSAKLIAARDAFSELFNYVTSGDGFYVDGSFIQHGYHPYTQGYGASLLASIVPVISWLSGSTWQVVDPKQSNIIQWVYSSFEPLIYDGLGWDMVRGREVSRSYDISGIGGSIMGDILQVSKFAPASDAARIKSMVKYWALANYSRNFAANEPLSTITYAKQVMADSTVLPRGELIGHYAFASMDRVVHLGKGYGFGLSMSSSRVANFESINSENLRGWFTGDGMNYLYNGDLKQFCDGFWPTVDAYRLPGITCDPTAVKTPPDVVSGYLRAKGETSTTAYPWVGGAKLGNYGAAGMQLDTWGVSLTAKKSWFMFDDEIVCLGAGITSTDGRPIETIIENRKLNSIGSNPFTVNSTQKSQVLGWSENLAQVQWAHLGGNLPGSDIGYYFPQPASIYATREARTGSFSEINADGSSDPITRNYLRMNFSHGSNPANATYQYAILPGRDANRTAQYSLAPHFSVLKNDANVQAVSETSLGITAANFWTDSSQSAGVISVNKKSSVLVQNDGTYLTVAICDPTQLNTGTVAVQIAASATGLVSADAGITVTQTAPSISLNVNVNASKGKTYTARFFLGAVSSTALAPEGDAFVYDATANVNTNFGTNANLTVKKSSAGANRESYLLFNVPVLGGTLLGATLGITPITVSTPGIHGIETTQSTWIESGSNSLTWSNRPSGSGKLLATWTPALNQRLTSMSSPPCPPAGSYPSESPPPLRRVTAL